MRSVGQARETAALGLIRLAPAATMATAALAGLGLTPAIQQPTFRAGTDLVRLEVSVIDNKGEPVRGLTAKDFAVSEDGRPQVVTTFKAVDWPDTVTNGPAPPAWADSVSRDVVTNSVERRRLLVIVMDDAVTDFDATVMESAITIAGDVIRQMGPHDLASVLFTRDTLNDQDFTSDHARLLATADTFVGTRSLSCMGMLDSLGTIEKAATYLAAAADAPKALVYITGSMPVDVGSVGGSCPLSEYAKDAFLAAERANIPVYPIDVCGVRPYIPKPPPPLEPCHPEEGPPFPRVGFLKTVAANTGGQPIVETNDFLPGIRQMFRDISSYYLIGYVPSNNKADGKRRRIEVKVPARHGVDVLTTKDYYAPEASAVPKRSPPSPSSQPALADLLPDAGVSLQLAAEPFKQDNKTAMIAVVVGVSGGVGTTGPPNAGDTADVTVRAFSSAGKLVTASTQTVRVPGVPGDGGLVRYDLHSTLALPPGRYELRAVVQSAMLAHAGSVFADLDVPDFGKAHVSLSGIALGPTVSVTPPNDSPSATSPVSSGTNRLFARDSLVSAFFRVYQGGTSPLVPVILHTKIQDGHDAVLTDLTATIAATDFDQGSRSADHRYALPLSALAPGEYLLTFEADRGKDTASRAVIFAVR